MMQKNKKKKKPGDLYPADSLPILSQPLLL